MVNGGKMTRKSLGKTNGKQDYLIRFAISPVRFPSLSGGEEWGHHHRRNSCPAFRQIGKKQRALPTSTFSQLSSALRNSYTRSSIF